MNNKETNILELWNKLHFEDEKTERIYRVYFLILAHPVYKMWIIQEPNTLELWNKLHFEEENKENIYHVQFLILAHPVYKVWIIQEPNTLELWNKLHFEEEENGEYIPCLKYSIPIFVEYKMKLWRLAVRYVIYSRH